MRVLLLTLTFASCAVPTRAGLRRADHCAWMLCLWGFYGDHVMNGDGVAVCEREGLARCARDGVAEDDCRPDYGSLGETYTEQCLRGGR